MFVDLVGGPLSGLLEGLTLVLDVFNLIMMPIGFMVESIQSFIGMITGEGVEGASTMQKIFGGLLTTLILIKTTTFAINALRKTGKMLSFGTAMAEKIGLKAKKMSTVAETASLGPKTASAGISGTKAAAEMSAASALTLGIGIATIIAGIVAGVAAMAAGSASASAAAKAGDVLSPRQGGGGYGKRMLLAPEGTFALNNNDTVLAGTNLFKSNDTISTGMGEITAGGGINKEDMIEAFSSANINSSMQYDNYSARSKTGQVAYGQIAGESKFA